MKKLLISALLMSSPLCADAVNKPVKPINPPKAHTCNECKTDAKKAKAEKKKAQKDEKKKKREAKKVRSATKKHIDRVHKQKMRDLEKERKRQKKELATRNWEPETTKGIATIYWSPDKGFARVKRDSSGNRVDTAC